MATKPMKSIKLPGLEDTYTFVQNDTTLSVSGAAADAKVTGDKISDLKSTIGTIPIGETVEGQISGLQGTLDFTTAPTKTTLADNSTNTSDGYIRYSDGANTGNSSYQHVDFININGYNRLEVYAPVLSNDSSGAGIAFYKSDKTYLSGVPYNVLAGTPDMQSVQIVDVPEEAVYVRAACRTSQKSDFYIKGITWFSAIAAIDSIDKTLGGAIIYNGTFNPPNFAIGKTINSSGVKGDALNYALSDYVYANESCSLLYTPTSNDCVLFVCEYDKSKTFIQRTRIDNIRTLVLTSNTKYIRFVIGKTDGTFRPTESWIYENFNVDIKNPMITANTDLCIGMQMFEKIGVIGDSIACGWAKDKNGNNSRRNTGISWVQQMARRLGCTAYNLGASGVDPIEWFQTDFEFYQYCLPQYQSVGACDLYIIGLGLNQGTLGSVSDINQSDYTQNGLSFYGQYARIIQMINAEHPNAVVMCLTEPTTAISSYDQAVRDICALDYINAELVDLENDYFDLFNTPKILAEHQPDGLHFTPYGYSLIADAMIKAMNDYIAKNSTSFKYVGVATV